MNIIKKRKFREKVFDKNIEIDISTISLSEQNNLPSEAFRSDYFSIGIILNGSLDANIDGKKQSFTKNTLYLLSPKTVKQINSILTELTLIKVEFTSHFLLQIGIQEHEVNMIEFIMSNGVRVIDLDNEDAIYMTSIMKSLEHKFETRHKHLYGVPIMENMFKIFLYELATFGVKYKLSNKEKISRKQEITMRFGNLVNIHYAKERSVKFYADLLSITPKYLTEVVTEVSGISPSDIIHDKIISEMKILLSNPKLSISQISNELNFSDQSIMGKFFKRFTGVSPSAFRV